MIFYTSHKISSCIFSIFPCFPAWLCCFFFAEIEIFEKALHRKRSVLSVPQAERDGAQRGHIQLPHLLGAGGLGRTGVPPGADPALPLQCVPAFLGLHHAPAVGWAALVQKSGAVNAAGPVVIDHRPCCSILTSTQTKKLSRRIERAFGPARLDKSELFSSADSAVKVSSNRTVWVPSL